jgi:hypothetical protein
MANARRTKGSPVGSQRSLRFRCLGASSTWSNGGTISVFVAGDKLENPLVYVERLRQQAEAFQRTVEEELRTLRAFINEWRVRQAKRRGHEPGNV